MQSLLIQPDFDSWREAARKLLLRGTPPDQVVWLDCNAKESLLPNMFANAASGSAPKFEAGARPWSAGPVLRGPPEPGAGALTPGGLNNDALPRVPPMFLASARTVSLHREPARWSLLYRLLWRLSHGEPHLLKITVDDDVNQLINMEKQVRRDIHKMQAFVRFRSVLDEQGEQMIAWHRPDHLIVPAAGPWFARRFPIMRWTILTPDASVTWDLKSLKYGPGMPASVAPHGDALEDLWKTYYAAIFNPARIKTRAMKKEMPVRHWPTLPEAELIDELLRQATPRVDGFMEQTNTLEPPATASAADFVPATLQLPVLARAAAECRGCELYAHATQVVFGQGPSTADVMFVGEQPGDKEDVAGTPFVGPAGQMLNRGLADAGIDRGQVYVTNAVKHFKFEQRGTRRLHTKPNAREISACRPWLEAEIAAVRPKLIVCLGATAAQSLMGPQFRITRDRGKLFTETEWAPALIATNHPSAILRVPDAEAREEAYRHFVADLMIVQQQMEKISRAAAEESARHHQKQGG
jgi:DNA polymerase